MILLEMVKIRCVDDWKNLTKNRSPSILVTLDIIENTSHQGIKTEIS